jgi:hypothetical protein
MDNIPEPIVIMDTVLKIIAESKPYIDIEDILSKIQPVYSKIDRNELIKYLDKLVKDKNIEEINLGGSVNQTVSKLFFPPSPGPWAGRRGKIF